MKIDVDETDAPVKHVVHLDYNQSVDIVLPGGSKVNIVLSYLEHGEQFPEFDIMLPKVLAANCFGEGLNPAKAHIDGDQHIRLAKQIIIPIEDDHEDTIDQARRGLGPDHPDL